MARALRREGLLCGTLVFLVLAVYWPALRLGFITYDDPDYVTSNVAVRSGLTWSDIKWAFTHTSSAEWHPLTMITHMADCQFYGLDARGHHLTNLLLHLANSLILYFLLFELTEAFWPSALVTFLFALHPLNVESVTWISERKGLLSTFFGLACLLSYARYAKSYRSKPTGRLGGFEADLTGCPEPASAADSSNRACDHPAHQRFFYGLSLVFLALGLLSKPMLVTWPFLMLLLDFWPLRRVHRDDLHRGIRAFASLLIEKAPFFALVLCSSAVTFLVARGWGAVTASGQTPISARLGNAVLAYSLYVKKIICPVNLSINYPFDLDLPPGKIFLATCSLALITVIAIRNWQRRPFLVVGWGWYLGTLVPVIGLLHFGNHFMADRYSYFTAIGIFIMVSWTVAHSATSKANCMLLGCCSAIAVAACGLAARHQLGYWHDTETLFKHALTVNSKDFVAWNNLGFYYETRGERTKAEECYRAALAISPGSTFALGKLASLLIDKGRIAEAINACELALRLDPKMPDVHCTLGLALMKEGKREAAVAEYLEALRLRPDFAPAHYNLANALAATGRFAEATEHLRRSLVWDPDSADAHNNLAYLLMRAGALDEAEAHFHAALRIKTDMWQADFGLADALARVGDIGAAQEYYRAALRAKPDFPEALTRLAWILSTTPAARLRSGEEAVALAEKACGLTGYKQPGSLQVLAAAYAEAGNYTNALEFAEKARSIAAANGQDGVARNVQRLIDVFASGHPYREPDRGQPR